MRILLAAFVAAVFIWAAANDVRAEGAAALTVTTPAAPAVDFSPVLNWALEIVAGLAVPVLFWLLARGAKLIGLQLDARQREAIYSAIDRAVSTVGEHYKRQGRDLAVLEVRDELVREAARIVVKRTPAAAKHFRLTREDVEDRVAAALGEKLPPVQPGTLPSGRRADRLAEELAALREQLARFERKPRPG